MKITLVRREVHKMIQVKKVPFCYNATLVRTEIDRFCYLSYQMTSCCITVRISIFDHYFTRDSHTFIERVYFLTSINRAQNWPACLRRIRRSIVERFAPTSQSYGLECHWSANFIRLSFKKQDLLYRSYYSADVVDPEIYKTCCEMGEENVTKSCADRVYSIEDIECKQAFWKCCRKKYGAKGKKVSDRLEGAMSPYFKFFFDVQNCFKIQS